MDINVSIDAKGNLVCGDTDGDPGSSFTWVPDPNTISSIQSITINAGSFSQAPTSSNSWNATLGAAGRFGNGQNGWQYTIEVNSKSGVLKQKSPKIGLIAPLVSAK